MKKSLLALAVLGAFAGAASAQSSVTVFGKIDQGVGKPIGTKDKQVRDGGGSRIGFRGQEDLGSGMFAVFSFEHRFTPDTGCDATSACAGANGTSGAAPSVTNTFWNGHSWVGLRSGFGQLTLGRHYVAAYTEIQNVIDPFGGDTVAGLRQSSMTPPGSLAKLRVADSIRYEFAAAGAKVVATVAEKSQPGTAAGPDRPWSLAGNYTAGPLFVGAGYEDPAGEKDRLLNLGARYTFGPATLRVGMADARTNATTTAASQKIRGYLVGANVKAGPGEVLVGYGMSKNRTTSTDLSKKWAVGYRHPLSKRTFLYADAARDSVPTANKTGYDLGVQHNF